MSLRLRMALAATASAAVMLVVMSVLLVRVQEESSVRQIDEILSDEAEAIGRAMETEQPIPLLFDDDRVVLVVDPDGRVVESEGLPADLAELATLDVVTRDDEGVHVTLDGDQHRVVAEPYIAADGRTGVVILAEPRDELDDSVAWLRATLLWVVPLSLVLLGALVWWVVGRTLRPVEQIRSEVASIDVRQLGRRVPTPGGDDEIARLAVTMNQMLARIEQSVRRQQRFVADASHELRTPLARMRAELEADELDPDHADPASTRRSQLEEIESVQRMIDDMLLLARADAGMMVDGVEAVDLDDIVLEELGAQRLAVANVVIDSTSVSAAQVRGRQTDLRRVVRNLLDNAVEHAASAVAVTLVEVERAAVLTIDDDGVGVPDERREEVFERFHRLNSSRTGSGHAGLGLSLVSEIVASHGGTVTIDDSPLGGARFTVTLPRTE